MDLLAAERRSSLSIAEDLEQPIEVVVYHLRVLANDRRVSIAADGTAEIVD